MADRQGENSHKTLKGTNDWFWIDNPILYRSSNKIKDN